MGNKSSKKEEQPSNDVVLKFEEIYFDEHGNLRVGRKNVKSKKIKAKELRMIMEIEDDEDPDAAEAPDTVWYIMDASWVASWFAYTHLESDTGTYSKIEIKIESDESRSTESRPLSKRKASYTRLCSRGVGVTPSTDHGYKEARW
jgi:hypothetical protein